MALFKRRSLLQGSFGLAAMKFARGKGRIHSSANPPEWVVCRASVADFPGAISHQSRSVDGIGVSWAGAAAVLQNRQSALSAERDGRATAMDCGNFGSRQTA